MKNPPTTDQKTCDITFQCSCKGNADSQKATAKNVGVHRSDPPQRYINCPHCFGLLYECPRCNTFARTERGPKYSEICLACNQPREEAVSGGLLEA